MSRIAVHMHVYYVEQLDDLLKKLQNLTIAAYDLYVTLTDDNEEIKQKIIAFKPNAKVWKVLNLGYDIGPFIDFLHKINLDDYDYVIKIHTKRAEKSPVHFNRLRFSISTWRNMLLDALLSSPRNIWKNIQLFKQDNQLGMIGSSYVLLDGEWAFAGKVQQLSEEMQKIGLNMPQHKQFIAGTMFMIRAQLLKPFLFYDISNFSPSKGNIHDGELAHVLERMFGLATLAQGYKIRGVQYHRYLLDRFLTRVKRFVSPIFKALNVSPTIQRQNYLPAQNSLKVAVFAFYDSNGIIHKYVLSYLRKLSRICDKIVFVADNEISDEQAEKIKGLVSYVQCSRHNEYDFGSYKRGFFWLKNQNWFNDVDEIIFCNDSCFSVGELKPVYDIMSAQKCDFWGMSENIDHQKHLQSFFLVFKKNVFHNSVFQQFLSSVKHEEDFMDVVMNYEVILTKLLEQEKFTSDAYVKQIISPHQYPLTTLNKNMPLVKKKTFTVPLYSLENLMFLLFKIKKISSVDYNDIAEYFGKSLMLMATAKMFNFNILKTWRFLYKKKITKKGYVLIKICQIPVYHRKEKS